MPTITQDWFEMPEIIRRSLTTAAWITLRAGTYPISKGNYGYLGHEEEFLGLGSLAVYLTKRGLAKDFGYDELGLSHNHGPIAEETSYVPAEIHAENDGNPIGVRLVISQPGNSNEYNEWHLNQDLIIALGLKREGDSWLAMDEGYLEVARLKRTPDKKPECLEIRTEHLRDYLCARGMTLCVATFRERRATLADISGITWGTEHPTKDFNGTLWEGHITEVHEGGMQYGGSIAVFHTSRTDVAQDDDVPTIGHPRDGQFKSESWTKKPQGRKLFAVCGNIYRTEWIEPATLSPRVRRDKTPTGISYVVDAAGQKMSSEELRDTGRWLWFKPEVIGALLRTRGSALKWCTKDTGQIQCSASSNTHFGINKNGFINVYAKDIGILPAWEQQIWAGHNISPDGGVSEELMASQVNAEPADTQAPEEALPEIYTELKKISKAKLGFSIFREHDAIPSLLTGSHRFQAVDKGLCSLAKDLARLTADNIDASSIQSKVTPPKGEKWGSLKSLEKLIATKIGDELAHKVMGPLSGIYSLRLLDAHLPQSDINEALDLIKVDTKLPQLFQGHQMIHSFVASLVMIYDVIDKKF